MGTAFYGSNDPTNSVKALCHVKSEHGNYSAHTEFYSKSARKMNADRRISRQSIIGCMKCISQRIIAYLFSVSFPLIVSDSMLLPRPTFVSASRPCKQVRSTQNFNTVRIIRVRVPTLCVNLARDEEIMDVFTTSAQQPLRSFTLLFMLFLKVFLQLRRHATERRTRPRQARLSVGSLSWPPRASTALRGRTCTRPPRRPLSPRAVDNTATSRHARD